MNYTKPTMKPRPVKKGTTTKKAMEKEANERRKSFTKRPVVKKKK